MLTPVQSKRKNQSSVCFKISIFGKQRGRLRILDPMVASIPEVQSALSFFMNKFGIVRFVPKYMTFATLSKYLLPAFML
jgi:hypothetical protein